MPFGDVLRALRKQHHMTQSELASVLRVAESAVSMWELGRRRPDHEMMEMIADYFNVDMNYLFGKTDVPNAFQAQFVFRDRSGKVVEFGGPRQISDDDLQFALWHGDSNMTEEDLRAVREYAEFLQQRKKQQ